MSVYMRIWFMRLHFTRTLLSPKLIQFYNNANLGHETTYDNYFSPQKIKLSDGLLHSTTSKSKEHG